ncbi:MAG: CoB--CoM heterodisulfide reductase iron-sulfur subunit B family protein [Pseudomonadota bacterium]
MKFTLFVGCNIPVRVQQYELAARAVSEHLNIEIEDNPEFKCCGNPIRNTDNQAFLLMAARNLALAEKQDLDIMVLCKCCFGSLKKAAHVLENNPLMKEQINTILAREDLHFSGKVQIKHFLSILYHDIGISAIQKKITRPYKNLNIATHYGCHALRPSEITGFDNPVAPVLFDDLVNVTGAKSIDWPLKLECCGAPLLGVKDDLSMKLTEKKLIDGRRAGADYLCAACPYCQMQFDRVQKTMLSCTDLNHVLSSIIYPQLLGLAMGIDGDALGLNMNVLDISKVESFLA